MSPKRQKRKKIEDFKDRPPRMALYLRVSTEEQAREGFSLDAQQDRMKHYCISQGYDIYNIFREEGESGRTVKRPQYRAMMDQIDLWDGILIMKMDRIHRNSRNFMAMMDLLRAQDKLFVSMAEKLDTSSAMGRFVMDIIQRIAQLESEVIGERVHVGMTQKAITPAAPGHLGGHAPFGFDFDDEGDYIIVDREARHIRQMFELYIKGESLENVAEKINKKGARTKQRKRPWTWKTVRYVIQNPIYAGWQRWDGHLKEGTHDVIISVDEFNQAQDRFRKSTLIPT